MKRKTTVWIFQATNEISHEKTWKWLRKGNFKWETKSIRIVAQINTIQTNIIKAKIDKMQKDSKCWLCDDRDKTINHILSKCSKLAQKEYKTRHDRVGKVIYWELCKKVKIDPTAKWYMHNPESILDNATHKILWVLRYKRIT